MNRTTLAALAITALAAAGLAGCATRAEAPTAAPAPAPVVATQQAAPAPSVHQPDEQGYLSALRSGTVIPGLVSTHAELRAATLEAGYGACNLIGSASSPELGMLQVLDFAEQHLGDPSVFTADMPALFTAAAAVHLCGVTP